MTLSPHRSIVPFRFLRWFLLPAWALVFLILFPPHALDIAVSSLFYVPAADAWPWHGVAWFSTLFHKAAKVVPIAVALGTLFSLARDARARRTLSTTGTAGGWDPSARQRLVYLFVAMLVSVLLVWRLKGVTGVACPWDVNLFGGDTPVRSPTFSLFRQPGNCWPAGHAGTGFCLFALYFFWRDAKPRLARAAFWFALLFGAWCGWIRVMQGAHFVSHVAVTGLIDWLVCSTLYILFFAPQTIGSGFRRALFFLSPSHSPVKSVHACVWATAAWWTFVFDIGYYRQLLANFSIYNGHAASILTTTGFSALLFLFISASLLYLLALLPKAVFRTMLVLLNLLGGLSLSAALLYGVIMTPDMVRNFLATDTHEALGYFSIRTVLVYLLLTLPPILLWTRVVRRESRKEVLLGIVLTLVCGVGAAYLNMQGFSSAMRNDKSLRYQIAPVNIVYSTSRTLFSDASPDRDVPRVVVDHKPEQTVRPDGKTVFVVVIGETTRSANWQIAGYERETTPTLIGQDDIVQFPRITACGTSTDVSLPCMLSRVGRRDYDRDRILSEESLPALLQRAGFRVVWIDNQSGCKGTCAGVPSRKTAGDEALCPSGVCFDEVFVNEVKNEIAASRPGEPTVLFLHLMGSHGPAYWARSPETEKVFTPECREADLGSCKREEILAAYDNSVRYTDRVLTDLITTLRTAEKKESVSTGLFFVSDHGESLGENGLFLHGAPYWMAPAEQVEVPGLVWLSQAFQSHYGTDMGKLSAARERPVQHDHLYHTLLGLLRVRTSAYDKRWDLTSN